jgi:hypothetical protein
MAVEGVVAVVVVVVVVDDESEPPEHPLRKIDKQRVSERHLTKVS